MNGTITRIDVLDEETYWIHIKLDAESGLFGSLVINSFIYFYTGSKPDVVVGQRVDVDVRPVYEGTVDEIADAFTADEGAGDAES